MMEGLLVPFQYEYMLKAMFVSALIAGVCALLSCFIILRGWSLMGDALSHAIIPGVSLAYLFHIPFALGAFLAGMAAAGAMAFIKNKTRIREDAIIGVVFTSFFALGLLLVSVYPTNMNLRSIVFGNLLGISDSETIQVLLISVVTLGLLLAKRRDLLLFCFDANHARSLAINVTGLHFLLLTLLAITAVAALQAVGVCLVVAMLVTPGATAYLLTDRFDRMLVLSCALAMACAVVGAYASYFINGSTGGCIVVLQTVIFLLALFFAPKYGLWANRAKPRKAASV